MQKILAIFAHPDDEAFGPGGSIALWATQGKEIHLLCATKGEAGACYDNDSTAQIRAKELLQSAKILGIQSVEFLNYHDGEISNKTILELQPLISKKIAQLQPDTLLTFNLNGVSGHIDHIAVASATTYAFTRSPHPQKLYYYCQHKEFSDQMQDYFVHFPDGLIPSQADEIVDTTTIWETKVKAMHCHLSQIKDITTVLERSKNMDKREYFIVKSK